MNETLVTVQGFVGTDPEERIARDAVVATFRIATTPRRFNKQMNTWADGQTSWYTVNAWRSLGSHCLTSVHKAEPVIVHGKLVAQVWQDDNGKDHQTMVIEAITVGHDLSKGTAAFLKASPAAAEVDDESVRERNVQLGVGGPQMTSNGQLLEDPAA
jgi:single-strand DNA-binding protein